MLCICRENTALAAHPSYPRMGNTLSMSHPGIFHDAPSLTHSDDKMVRIAVCVLSGWRYIREIKEFKEAQTLRLFLDLGKTIEDGTRKREIASQVYLNKANLSFACNSLKAILNPHQTLEKRSFSLKSFGSLFFRKGTVLRS